VGQGHKIEEQFFIISIVFNFLKKFAYILGSVKAVLPRFLQQGG
jgi:hypothetical protein